MRILSVLSLVLAAAAAGCAATPGASPYDAAFGDAVLRARVDQTVDPNAAKRRAGPPTTSGVAAKAAVDRYLKSTETPPPPVNVFNIGVGESSTSGSTSSR